MIKTLLSFYSVTHQIFLLYHISSGIQNHRNRKEKNSGPGAIHGKKIAFQAETQEKINRLRLWGDWKNRNTPPDRPKTLTFQRI